jgi:alpha-D-xyloside xylohydrolase
VGGFDYAPAHFDERPDLALWDTYGGDADDPQDPVVYVRWLQFGVFSSHLRAHGKPPREPWRYGEQAEAIARRYLKLRYRLLPYIYTEAVKSAETGLPMVRPLALTHQDDPTTRSLDQQYMFGDDFLVAPVFREDGRAEVYLPAGEWIDFWTKERLTGPRWLRVTARLDTLPVWVRGGAIVPFGPEMRYVDERPLNPLTIELYAPGERGELVIRDEDAPDIEVRYRRDVQGEIELTVRGAPGEVRWLAF